MTSFAEVDDLIREGYLHAQSNSLGLPPGTIDMALELLDPKPNPYINDPVGWAEEKLRIFLWSMQKEIMEAVRDHRMVAVKSCHGPGKSFTASCVPAWWLDVHPLGSAFALTTAPSWPQVEAILWREMRRRFNQGKLRGRITLDCQWHLGAEGTKRGDATEELIAMGRKPADYDESTLQGLHARYFLAILDEAGGIDEGLWKGVLALLTNENARVLAIGNPDDPNSHFAQICKPGSGWHVITIPVWETPLFSDPAIARSYGRVRTRPPESVPEEVAEGLVSPLWVKDRELDWGIDSPTWVSKIDGEFPDISDEYLFTPALISIAHLLELPGLAPGRFALDVARMGTDKSVLYRNRDGRIRIVDEWAKMDTMATVGRASAILSRYSAKRVPINVDAIGVGAGVYDRLRERGFNVGPYVGSVKPLNPKKFFNRRSEVYWNFREAMALGQVDLDPADHKLAAQLQAIKWSYTSDEKIKVETKEDMRKRQMPSPDRADAVVMTTVSVGAVAGHAGMPGANEGGGITGDILTKVM